MNSTWTAHEQNLNRKRIENERQINWKWTKSEKNGGNEQKMNTTLTEYHQKMNRSGTENEMKMNWKWTDNKHIIYRNLTEKKTENEQKIENEQEMNRKWK